MTESWNHFPSSCSHGLRQGTSQSHSETISQVRNSQVKPASLHSCSSHQHLSPSVISSVSAPHLQPYSSHSYLECTFSSPYPLGQSLQVQCALTTSCGLN